MDPAYLGNYQANATESETKKRRIYPPPRKVEDITELPDNWQSLIASKLSLCDRIKTVAAFPNFSATFFDDYFTFLFNPIFDNVNDIYQFLMTLPYTKTSLEISKVYALLAKARDKLLRFEEFGINKSKEMFYLIDPSEELNQDQIIDQAADGRTLAMVSRFLIKLIDSAYGPKADTFLLSKKAMQERVTMLKAAITEVYIKEGLLIDDIFEHNNGWEIRIYDSEQKCWNSLRENSDVVMTQDEMDGLVFPIYMEDLDTIIEQAHTKKLTGIFNVAKVLMQQELVKFEDLDLFNSLVKPYTIYAGIQGWDFEGGCTDEEFLFLIEGFKEKYGQNNPQPMDLS